MSRPKTTAILAFIILCQVSASGLWMHLNGFLSPHRPPFHDCAYFRLHADDIMLRTQQEGLQGWLAGGYHHDHPHPPILAMLNALAGLPFDDISTKTQWIVQAAYLATLVVALYLLGRTLLPGRGWALLFAMCGTAAPVFIASARVALPKFSMMVMVMLALHALLRSECFRRRGLSLAFGFWTGIANLTMMLAPVYLIGSAAAALLLGLRRGPAKRVLLNASLSVALSAATTALWYLKHWPAVARYASLVTGPEGQNFWSRGVGPWSPERWLYYPVQLVNNGLGFALAATIVGVLVLYVLQAPFRRRHAEETPDQHPTPGAGRGSRASYAGLILAVGAITSTVIVTRGQVAAQSQYIMNLPPLVLLLGMWCTSRMKFVPLRRIAIALLLLGTVISAALAYRPVDQDVTPPEARAWWISVAPTLSLQPVTSMDTYGGGPARSHAVRSSSDPEHWPLDELIDNMEAHKSTPNIRYGEIRGVMIHPYVTAGSLRYVARKRGLPMTTGNAPGFPPYSLDDMRRFVNEFEFIIADPLQWSLDTRVGRLASDAHRLIDETGATLTPLFERQITDRSSLVLYRLTPPVHAKVIPGDLPKEVAAITTRYENGWELAGFRWQMEADGEAVGIRTYWKLGPSCSSGFTMLLRSQKRTPDGKYSDLGDRRLRLAAPSSGEAASGILELSPDPLPFPAGSRVLLVMTADGGAEEADPERRISESELPRLGDFTLVLMTHGDDGSVTIGDGS